VYCYQNNLCSYKIATFSYTLSSVIASHLRVEIQHYQQKLFALDIWQHCDLHFELLCLAASSKQLTFLPTARTFATRLSR
jgi:hypothetical protein